MSGDTPLRADPRDAPGARPDRTVAVVLGLALLVLVTVLAMWLWSARPDRQPPAPPQAATAPAVRESPAPAPAGREQVLHPIAPGEQALEPQEIPAALGGLLGAKAVSTFLQTDSFPRRFAATVDSLAREHSPPAIWPVLPAPGHFLVEERPDGTVIAAENAARYTPLLLLAGTIDVPAAVRVYRRMYPLLQQAYRELGFGDRYLNDRVVEVIDVLLATPDAPEAPRVQLLPVRGTVPSLQPWVRYQFVDEELEALSAGQKILVRVGPVNQHRLKAKLTELRNGLTAPAGAAAALPANDASAPVAAPASPGGR